jgi:hypothetical protein
MALTPDQIIAQCFAKATQRIAHGGLGNGQVSRSLGQAFFGHDFVKNPEQVQVQSSEIGMDGLNHFECE